jgi:glycine/D-amino acid oxidase-like deaminating enzyme|tara:strand:- start:24 stop:338 length:315 start_codon:yes stop_codon:yes gene_type:complete
MNRRDFLKILGLFSLSPKKIYAQKTKSKEAVVVGAGIIGSSVAYELFPKDDLPIIGRFKNKSVYIAVMHSGISLAAIVGNLVTQEIVDEVDSLLLKDFRPSRFF